MDLISDYCRICLKTVDNLQLIDSKISQNFLEISQIELDLSESYSKNICGDCVVHLEENCLYKQLIVSNQEKLKSLVDQFVVHKVDSINVQDSSNQVQLLEIVVSSDNVVEAEETKESLVIEGSHEIQEESITIQQSENQKEHDTQNTPNSPLPDTEEITLNSPDPPELKGTKKSLSRKRLKEPIKCSQCDKTFFYKSYLSFHFKDVHIQQNEVCPTCGKLFKNSRRLNSHLLTHSKTKKFQCEICQKEFNFSGDYTRHLRIHNNVRPYKCDQCSQSFKQSYALTLHKKNKHEMVKFKCENCGSDFSCKPTLKKHLLRCINGNLRMRKSGNGNFSYGERNKYKCLVENCDKIYAMRKYLKTHIERDHGMSVENFETTCLECQKVFSNVGDYSVHIKVHSCNFVCTLCQLRFKTELKLKNHEEKFHKEEEERPFKCESCQATFKRNEHLRAHVLYKHSETRPFSCPECLLSFRQRGEFNIHLRIHSGVKPFKCNQCDYESKTSSNLRQHTLIMHENENIYQCKDCDKKFKYAVDLNLHKRQEHPVS